MRIRSTSRVCSGPGRGTYVWEAGRRRGLTPKEGMNGVIVLMIPATRERALRDVIMVVVMKRDGGTVDGGSKREEEEKGTSNGGEHCAGRESAREGAMMGEVSPYKVDSLIGSAVRFTGPRDPSPVFHFPFFAPSPDARANL